MENSTQELKVESVKAINNKEIVVTFNKELDKTSAETVANYTLSNVSLGAVTPKLSADKKSVTLTVATPAAQQATSDVTVKNVKDATGTVVAETKKSVTFFDTVAPVAQKVEVTGPKSLKVTFSEPMQPLAGNPITFKLNGGAYSVTPSLAADGKSAILTLGAVLPTGTHDLEVSGGKDFAGFAINKTNLSFEYAADATAPTVSVDKATEQVVTLKFDKPVKATGLNTDVTVYHTVNNATGYVGTLAAVGGSNGYSDTYTATFNTPIAAGTDKTIFLNTKADKFEDQWGNDVASTSLSFDIVADVTAPTVTKAESTGTAQQELTVTFDKEVVEADAENKANYVLKDAQGNVVKTADFAGVDNNGKFVAGVTLAYDNAKKQVKINLPSALKAADYKLEVSNIKDTSFAGNKMVTQTVNLPVADKIAPKVAGITHDSANRVIYVNFDEAMNTTDIANVANYGLLISSDSKSLPTGSTVEVVSPQKVKITIPADATYPAGGNTVEVQVVGTVKDVAGNAIGGLFGTSTNSITWATPSTFTITPVQDQLKYSAKNQLKFELNQELSAIDSTKFTLTNSDSANVASATYVNNAGKSTVTVTLDKNLTKTDLSTITSLAIANDGLTNAEGLALSSGPVTFAKSSTHIKDVVAPEAIKAETTGSNVITLTFSEDLRAGDVSNLTFNVAGNTVASVNNTSNADKVIITLQDAIDGDATPKVTQTLDLRDVAGNVLPAGTAITATEDKIAVAATATASVQDTVAAGASTVITFSEPLDAASKTAVETAVKGGVTGVTGTDLGFAWNGNKVTVTNNNATTAATFATDVTVSNVKDVAGNNTGSVSIDLAS